MKALPCVAVVHQTVDPRSPIGNAPCNTSERIKEGVLICIYKSEWCGRRLSLLVLVVLDYKWYASHPPVRSMRFSFDTHTIKSTVNIPRK